ncbi:MAG: hypothetical protein C4K58_08350 [Flavobacteriaceae bacterium]|nr:MAG: hypothetical protein C4K58_08350 [Flavobacteriaceae bacterium]
MKKYQLSLMLALLVNFCFAQTEKGKFMIELGLPVSLNNTNNTYSNESTKKYEELGATADYYEGFAGNTKSKGILKPGIGYFVIDNLALGFNVDLSSSNYAIKLYGYSGDDDTEYEQNSTEENNLSTFPYDELSPRNYQKASANFKFNPFVRYYIGEGKLKPFVQIDATVGSSYTFEDQGGARELVPNEDGTYDISNYVYLKSLSAQEKSKPYRLFYYGAMGGAAYFVNDNLSVNLAARYFNETNWMYTDYLNPQKDRFVTSGFTLFTSVTLYL